MATDNRYNALNEIAWLKKQWETGDQAQKDWAANEAQKYYKQLSDLGYGNEANQIRGMDSLQAASYKNQPNIKAAGLSPFRATAEQAGFKVGYDNNTGAVTLDGRAVDTSKMTLAGDNRYYVDPNSLNRLMDNTQVRSGIQELSDWRRKKYNSKNDEAYQAALTNANNQGKAAFNRTLANIAARTGGNVSSAATAAAGQAANVAGYNAAINLLPQYEQMDYQRQQQDLDNRYRSLQALSGYENQAYNRYIDENNTAFNRGVTEAGLTGMYNGSPTLQKQQIDFNQAMQTKEFDRNVLESDRNYALALGQDQRAAEEFAVRMQYLPQQLQQEVRRGQLSIEEAEMSISQSKQMFPLQLRLTEAQIGATNRSNTGSGSSKSTFTPGQVLTQAKAFANQKQVVGTNDMGDEITRPVNSKQDVISYVLQFGLDSQETNDVLLALGIDDGDLQLYAMGIDERDVQQQPARRNVPKPR